MLSESQREIFRNNFESLYGEFRGRDYDDILNTLLEKEMTSDELSTALKHSMQRFDKAFSSSSFPDFENLSNVLTSEIDLIKENNQLNLEDKKRAVANLSVMLGVECSVCWNFGVPFFGQHKKCTHTS